MFISTFEGNTSFHILHFKNSLLFCCYVVIELMARVENMTGLKAKSSSVTTGKKWSSGADMAIEVTENRDKYLGG